jgi:hypothetical protein
MTKKISSEQLPLLSERAKLVNVSEASVYQFRSVNKTVTPRFTRTYRFCPLRENKDVGSWSLNLVKRDDDREYESYPVGFPGWSNQYQALPEKTQCLMAYRYCRRIMKRFVKLHPEWKRDDYYRNDHLEGPRFRLYIPIIGQEDEDDDDWDTSLHFHWGG